MIRNLIFGNGGTFYPCLPFSDNFDIDTPLEIIIFVLVPRNLIMSGVLPDSIQALYGKQPTDWVVIEIIN